MAVDYGQGGEGPGGENDGVVFWSRREKEDRKAKPGEGEGVEIGESTEVGETEGPGELDKRGLGKEVLGVLGINVYGDTTLEGETSSLWGDAA